jgi:uncharacterized protein YndB with AHSA1/START domain
MKNLNYLAPDPEIVTKKEINTPQKMVFKAWDNPDILINWWGPKGLYQYLS